MAPWPASASLSCPGGCPSPKRSGRCGGLACRRPAAGFGAACAFMRQAGSLHSHGRGQWSAAPSHTVVVDLSQTRRHSSLVCMLVSTVGLVSSSLPRGSYSAPMTLRYFRQVITVAMRMRRRQEERKTVASLPAKSSHTSITGTDHRRVPYGDMPQPRPIRLAVLCAALAAVALALVPYGELLVLCDAMRGRREGASNARHVLPEGWFGCIAVGVA